MHVLESETEQIKFVVSNQRIRHEYAVDAGAPVVDETGEAYLTRFAAPADRRASFQYRDAKPCACEVSCRDQAVVSGAGDNEIEVTVACRGEGAGTIDH